ncbi:flap endonuclease-1 [compost metagenome]
MGIKDLSKIYTPESLGTIPLSFFTGHRIAVDAGVWMCASWANACRWYINKTDLFSCMDNQSENANVASQRTNNPLSGTFSTRTSLSSFRTKGYELYEDINAKAYSFLEDDEEGFSNEWKKYLPAEAESEIRKQWLVSYRQFIVKMLQNGITPIFCLDGEPPMEKTGTRAKRKKAREEAKVKLDNFIASIQHIDPLLRNAALLADYRKRLNGASVCPYPDPEYLRSLLYASGIPFIQCTEEAERLCTALYNEGWVAAVYSTDTDNLVHGCGLMLKAIKGNGAEYVYLPKLLEGLQLSHPEFKEMCIMAGCDYNTNIFRVGIKKSLDNIQKCKSIDLLPEKFDITPLNHQTCRRLFTPTTSQAISQDFEVKAANLKINLEFIQLYSRTTLESYGIGYLTDDLVKYVALLPEPRRLREYLNPTSASDYGDIVLVDETDEQRQQREHKIVQLRCGIKPQQYHEGDINSLNQQFQAFTIHNPNNITQL